MNEKVFALHDLSRPTRQCRAAELTDLAAMAVLGGSGSMFEQVLRHRYPSLDGFFSEVFEQSETSVAYVSNDERGAIVAWACCVAFHRRAGYAGVVQLALGWRGEVGDGAATEVYRSCEAACRARNVRTIIGFATRKTPGLALWYAENAFESLGALPLAEGDELRVFCKAVGQ